MGGPQALAHARCFQGRNEEALQQINESVEIDPNVADALTSKTNFLIANCKASAAIDWCEKSFALVAGDYWTLTDLVASYTAIGDTDKAASAKTKLLRMNPDLTISFYKSLNLSSNPVWRKNIEENIWAHLRKAGIPE